ncbi:DNA translocase SpoIIIE, partial [termite gut metagenome]
MPKKNTGKEPSKRSSFFSDIVSFVTNETVHFVIGLLLVIFSVYLLLAFISFFFTGAADQSILDGNNPEILSSINNGVRNYAGSRGAQLASYLINDCFGVSSFLFVVMGSVLGLHLMRVRQFRIWKWFFCCLFLLIWFSVALGFTLMELYEDS